MMADQVVRFRKAKRQSSRALVPIAQVSDAPRPIKNIQHTVRYAELSPARFRNLWRD
jgi:hypothetical protein